MVGRDMNGHEAIRVLQVVGKMNNAGVETVVMNYFRNIDRGRVLFDFIIDSDSKNPPVEEIESLGGRAYIVPPYKSMLRYLFCVFKIIKENKYKIVHSHLNTVSVFPLFAAFLAGADIRIAHNHSTAVRGEPKTVLKNVFKPFARIFATHYFACSEYAGRWLFGDRSVEKGNVAIINNAINTDNFKFDEGVRNEVRHELGIEDKFVIGHVGRFVYPKNHELLIDIFSEVYKLNNNAVLVLVGDGDLKEEAVKKVEHMRLKHAVRFLGNRMDSYRFYQGFDAFVLPSRYEGLPVVGLESQASGVSCFYSSEITDKVKVTDLVEFISLQKPALYWAERILQAGRNARRSGYMEQVGRAGYDIRREAGKLLNYYADYTKLQ
ncbi:glycosyltransferase involved in cell wall biosynthesis [Ruminiclostridium sufflavum DSM 19573]|uniref:Glycosyltransferase involved in cell wall biosynthesis n=1 Tax=Ruminiclostridium sufflavum DSM 19573 TaxID=1121337 RepID=A0A318XSC6_9FIRM|nr:glycosyltransferase family 1 protein [Ruminiclostridium sufflavum]PYG89474.1 glycosyltransferase involved in cell wall biosynthesis [Ruminiclostridium sufflavum DSM 19573]